MYPENTPAGLGKEETDPCAALDGAACTQSETAAQSSSLPYFSLLLTEVPKPDSSVSEAEQHI